jgi:hypothetical protein
VKTPSDVVIAVVTAVTVPDLCVRKAGVAGVRSAGQRNAAGS